MSIEYDIEIPPGGFVTAEGDLRRFADQLVLDVSDGASRRGLLGIRRDMTSAKLGRLGRAIDSTSDKRKGNPVLRRGNVSRASGVIFIRSKSPRTVGAIISYTEGSTITPRNGRYLWIPTDQIQRMVGSAAQQNRERLTPRLWNERGLDRRFGPLVRIRSTSGAPLLVIRNAAVNEATGRVGSRTTRGNLRRGQIQKDIVVAFVGISTTSRSARVNPRRRAFEAVQQAGAELRGG